MAKKVDEGVHNNIMASTSSNPPEAMVNRVNSTQDQGVNGSGGNRSAFESEINQIKQLVLDLECEEKDIAKQLQSLKSRGKKRKQSVNVWQEGLLDMKKSANEMNNLKDIHEIDQLIKNMKRHKEKKPLTLSTEFVGRGLDENINKVLKLLADDKVFVIGIYGMGGVGKTLLATLVENEVKRKETFKDVFWVTVSHNHSNSKLQHDIAKRIGLKLDEDDERIRAQYLSLALDKKGNSILILDDVWKYIDLQRVGIHLKVNGIKVILTTRLEHVCHQMDCQPGDMIQILPLSCYKEDEDEYSDEDGVFEELFMRKLGHDGTFATLPFVTEVIARCIVKRCEGLPLAIIVMARAMKGINDIHQWEYTLNKLENLEMGQEMKEEVFKVLKHSYDNLMENDLQNCFLYCAQLFNIELDKFQLIMKLVDSGAINGNRSLDEIFNEGSFILDKLKAHSLIGYKYLAYTHPLVRSMACYILKESQRNALLKLNERLTNMPLSDGLATDLELVHIWRCDMEKISEGVSPFCPKLSTLIINEVSISHVPESFFKYMNSLTILDLSHNKELESLPNSVTELRSLVSLVLNRCFSLIHVPPLGKLQALSRLVISVTSIEQVPPGLEKLTNLKWLDLSENKSLKLELGSSLSNLTKMQYLDLRDTCAMITVEDVQGMNMLECFGGTFECKHYHEQNLLDLIFGLNAYHLIFGNVLGENSFGMKCNDSKSIVPGYPSTNTIQFGDCAHLSHILPADLTCLYIHENKNWVCLCDALSYKGYSSLRRIETNDCLQLDSLFCLSSSCTFCTKILRLEVLKLRSLVSLNVVCKVDVGQSLSPGSIFSCLKEFYISNCHLIEKLLTPQLVQQLQNLETITVRNCDSMKEIFEVNNRDDDDSSSIALPKLVKLELRNLPQLKIVCKGSICCQVAPTLVIIKCPNLEGHPTIEISDVEMPEF